MGSSRLQNNLLCQVGQ